MKNRLKVKKYLKELQSLSSLFKRKKVQLEQAVQLTTGLMQGADTNALLEKIGSNKKTVQVEQFQEQPKKPKLPKGESHRISLKLFKAGKSIKEIAEKRSMALGTVEGHLISFIPSGEFISESKIEIIRKAIEELGEASSTPIREKLGDEFSYGEIRAVIKYNRRLNEEKI